MKLIATLYEKDIFPDKNTLGEITYYDRPTGKAIIFNTENKIALVGNSLNDFLQLPGGGIDDGEEIEDGLIRECLEETGCVVTILDKVGCIDDYRPRDKKHNINHCYIVKVLEQGDAKHTENEAEIGMHTKWFSLEEVVEIFRKQKEVLEAGKVTFYNTGFNLLRDFLFLEEALKEKKL